MRQGDTQAKERVGGGREGAMGCQGHLEGGDI